MGEQYHSSYQPRYKIKYHREGMTIAALIVPFHDVEISTFISTADFISNMFESKLLRIQCAH